MEIPLTARRVCLAGMMLTTDIRGEKTYGGERRIDREPEPGSIVLTEGDHGTAWQRQFKDGRWHRIGGGRPRDWAWVMSQRRVRLIYDAPVREAERFDDRGIPVDWTGTPVAPEDHEKVATGSTYDTCKCGWYGRDINHHRRLMVNNHG